MTMAGTVASLSGKNRGGRVYKSLALAEDAPFSMWAELMQPNGIWKWHQIIIGNVVAASPFTDTVNEGGVVILRSPKQENLVKLRITEVVSKWTLPVSWRQWLVEVGRPHAVQFMVEKDEATTTSNRRKGEIFGDTAGRCLLVSCSTIQELDVLILAAERRVAGRKKIERILVDQPVLVLDPRRGQWEKRLVQVGDGLLSVYDYQSDGTLNEGELVKRMPLTMNLTIRSLSDLGNCKAIGNLEVDSCYSYVAPEGQSVSDSALLCLDPLLGDHRTRRPLTGGATPSNAEDLREAGTPFTRGLLGGLPGNGGDVWEVGLELCSIDDDNRVDHTIVLMPRSCEERDTLVSALRLAMTMEPPTFDGASSTETDGRACKGGFSGKVQRLSKEVEELRAELMLTRKLASTGGVDLASRALVSSSLMPVVEEDEDTLLKVVSSVKQRAKERLMWARVS
ncbi:hypothetical protein FOZ62_012800 [Perkinsus olseni]|uniref:Uncharacterized protein n=1 Tax=Perkinsus olseni TaxID=32597 RepID=A0A7J6TBG6_PEROL|nr:hypothetical protein FOZ62_012800 [Perkinsus olseni]